MRNIKILNLSSYLILVLAFLILPQTVFALGQMSEPIKVDDAIRGEKIQQEMIIVNSDAFETPVELVAEGDISAWTTFYMPDNLGEAIIDTVIPAKENTKLFVVFSLPDDLAGGDYYGTISVVNLPPEDRDDEGSFAYVRQKIDREVFITVSTGEERIDISQTSVIPKTYDVAPGNPLEVRVIYDNQSNISLSPQVKFTVKRKGENVYNVIHPYPENDASVSSLSQHEIESIKIPTTGWEEGRYLVDLEFSHNNETILEKEFTFTIATPAPVEDESVSLGFTGMDKRLIAFVVAILLIVLGFVVKKFLFDSSQKK